MNKEQTLNVGIDFSKEKFNACLLMDQEIMGESKFPNDSKGYREFLKWAKSMSGLKSRFDPSSVLFCGEHTGACSIGLSDYLCSKGYRIWLENPYVIKRSSGLNRVKNDRADARMIAVYAKRHYEAGVTCLYMSASPDLKKLCSLYVGRDGIVRDRVAKNNRLKSGAFDDFPKMKKMAMRQIADAKRDEKTLEKEMVSLMETSPDLASNYRILTSFPGIGPITAAVFIIYTQNFRKFIDPRKFSCFCGAAPFGEQSGTSINRKPHVSRYAHRDVKAALVQACISAIRHNPVIREYAMRLKEMGKHDGIILNNVKNKIIHILFKMIQTRTMWNPDYRNEHGQTSEVKIVSAIETAAADPGRGTTINPTQPALKRKSGPKVNISFGPPPIQPGCNMAGNL